MGLENENYTALCHTRKQNKAGYENDGLLINGLCRPQQVKFILFLFFPKGRPTKNDHYIILYQSGITSSCTSAPSVG